MLNRRLLIGLLAALSLIAAACGGSDDVADADSPAEAGSDAEAVAEASDEAAEEPVADEPEPTSVPEPTAEPEPTATSEPEPTATPEPEPTAAPEPEAFADLDAFVEEFLADTGLEGAGVIIVDRDDGVVHHEAYGEFTTDRISMIASSSKMITAGVLMHLDDDGLIDVDAPLTDSVEWAADHPDMTAAQLVSNSSGLVGLFPELLYAPYLCQWLPNGTMEQCAETVLTTAGDDDDVIAPDSEFRYGGAQWQVAGGVAEAVSGQSWADLLEEIYIEPCGLDTLGYLSLGQVDASTGYPIDFGGDPALHEPTDNPNMEGGAYISTGDYGKLLLMHLRGGECEGGPVLSQDALDTMHGDRIADAYEGNAFGADSGYGMGWWVDRETGIITDGGAWGALAWLNLEEGYGGYWIIEDQNATTGAISDDLLNVVHVAMTGEEL